MSVLGIHCPLVRHTFPLLFWCLVGVCRFWSAGGFRFWGLVRNPISVFLQLALPLGSPFLPDPTMCPTLTESVNVLPRSVNVCLALVCLVSVVVSSPSLSRHERLRHGIGLITTIGNSIAIANLNSEHQFCEHSLGATCGPAGTESRLLGPVLAKSEPQLFL